MVYLLIQLVWQCKWPKIINIWKVMVSGEWAGKNILEDVVQNAWVERHVYGPVKWSTKSKFPVSHVKASRKQPSRKKQ